MLDDFSSMAWHARRNSVSMIIITNYYPEKRQQLFCKEILMCGVVMFFYILFFILYQTGSIKGAPLANIFYTQVYLWRKYEMEWRKKLLVLNFLPHNNLKLSWSSSLILNLLLTWLFCDVMSYYHYHLYNHFNHNTTHYSVKTVFPSLSHLFILLENSTRCSSIFIRSCVASSSLEERRLLVVY